MQENTTSAWKRLSRCYRLKPLFQVEPAIKADARRWVLTHSIRMFDVHLFFGGGLVIWLGCAIGISHGDWGWGGPLIAMGLAFLYWGLWAMDIQKLVIDLQNDLVLIRAGHWPFPQRVALPRGEVSVTMGVARADGGLDHPNWAFLRFAGGEGLILLVRSTEPPIDMEPFVATLAEVLDVARPPIPEEVGVLPAGGVAAGARPISDVGPNRLLLWCVGPAIAVGTIALALKLVGLPSNVADWTALAAIGVGLFFGAGISLAATADECPGCGAMKPYWRTERGRVMTCDRCDRAWCAGVQGS